MKRAISLILACLLITLAVPAGAYSADDYPNGDVNMDKRLSVQDATYIQKSLAQLVVLSQQQEKLADFDLDGKADIMDATKIQKVLANLDDYPVEPTTAATTVTQTASATETEAGETTAPSTSATDSPETTEPFTTPTQTLPSSFPTDFTSTATDATDSNPTVPPTETQLSSEVNVYFTNNKSWSDVYFYLYNSSTGDAAEKWPGQKISNYTTNSYGEKIYSLNIDVSRWNRIIFNDGGSQQTVDTPLSKASSGFFIASGSGSKMIPGTYAYTGADSGKKTITSLEYSAGYNKKIWIWTPGDYSPTSEKKFKTLYITDGQNLFDDDHTDGFGGWQVTDAVESLMANGGRGMIIVGIDNGNAKRDSELTPDIGNVKSQYQSEFASRTGKAFSDFVVDKVMPYVQSNYNSGTAAEDNAIIGSSSGGLEAFYIGMEHMDKFGHIGALSPAFALFSDSVWDNYLSNFNLSDSKMPRLYIYNGNADSVEKELYADTVAMYNRLSGGGYDSSKITLVLEEKAQHNEGYWRLIFPEMLCWCYQP